MHVREQFDYDQQSGELIWKVKTACKIVVGRVAGGTRPDGYKQVKFNGKREYVHRLVWEWHNGPIPEGMVVDHIDQDKSNSRIENLRLLTHSQNLVNGRPQRNSKTGHRGVSFDKRAGKFVAMSRQKFLGQFATMEDAAAAYQRAQDAYIADF